MSNTSSQTKQKKSTKTGSVPLRESVLGALQNYFDHLGDQPITDLYDLVLNEIELPLLEIVMRQANNNQSKAAHILGLNRGTLRKKLIQYGFIN